MSKAIELDEASVATLAEKLGQIIQRVVREELATMRASLTPQPPDLRRTGLDLSPEEQAKAVEAKAAIRMQAVERQGLIDVKRAAAILSVSPRTLHRIVDEKTAPEPVRIGTCVRWREVELLAWLEEGCPVQQIWAAIRKKAVQDYEMARRKR